VCGILPNTLHPAGHQQRLRNFLSVKVFRMDLEADFKRLFGVVFGVR
jgi:hypothetical protein